MQSPFALPCWQHAITREHRRTLLLSARTTTVNVHRGISGRNCRETIASLRNARATSYHVTNFLCVVDRQWLRRQRYHVLARIISECRYAEREGEDPDCKSERPAAPATQSDSSSHAVILMPPGIKASLFPDPLRIFRQVHFHPPQGMLQSVHRKCSRRMLLRRAFASSLRPPPAATSLS